MTECMPSFVTSMEKWLIKFGDNNEAIHSAIHAAEKSLTRLEDMKPKLDECLSDYKNGKATSKTVKKVFLEIADAQAEYASSFRAMLNALPDDDPDDPEDPDDGYRGCLAAFFEACRQAFNNFVTRVANFFRSLWNFICKLGRKIKELAIWICHKIAEACRRFAQWVSCRDQEVVLWLETRC